MPMIPAVMIAEAISKNPDKGLNFGDFADDFALKVLLVGADVAEEQLVFFVSGQLSLYTRAGRENKLKLLPR